MMTQRICPVCRMPLREGGGGNGVALCARRGVHLDPRDTPGAHTPGLRRQLEVARAVIIPRPVQDVAPLFDDLEALPLYKESITHITFLEADGEDICTQVRGRILGIPFELPLYFHRDKAGGFRSVGNGPGPVKSLSISYALKEVEGGTLLSHVERYEFANPLATWFAKLFCRREMEERLTRELRRVRRFILEPNELARAKEGFLVEGDPRVEAFDPQPRESAARVNLDEPLAALAGFGLGAAMGRRWGGRFSLGLLGAAGAVMALRAKRIPAFLIGAAQ